MTLYPCRKENMAANSVYFRQYALEEHHNASLHMQSGKRTFVGF